KTDGVKDLERVGGFEVGGLGGAEMLAEFFIGHLGGIDEGKFVDGGWIGGWFVGVVGFFFGWGWRFGGRFAGIGGSGFASGDGGGLGFLPLLFAFVEGEAVGLDLDAFFLEGEALLAKG